MALVPFAYQRDGAVYVSGDGPELLVFSGANDAPLWKQFCEGILAGVGATRDSVIAADVDGRVEWYRSFDGELLERVELDESLRGLDVAPGGMVVALGRNQLFFVQPSGLERAIPVPHCTAVRFGPGGASLGVGTADGVFYAIDPVSGAAWGTLEVGGAVRDVAWSEQGHWVVAAGSAIVEVSGDGTTEISRFDAGEPVLGVDLPPGGAIVAAALESQVIVLWELAERRSCGRITFQRDIGRIRFGPGTWLGAGFEDGDVNRIDLLTGNTTKCEAHVGRVANRWAIHSEIRPDMLRGAMAAVRAGGQPLATRVKHAWDQPRKLSIQPATPKGPGCFTGCTVILLLLLLSGCCGGLSIGGWWYFFEGLGPLAPYVEPVLDWLPFSIPGL